MQPRGTLTILLLVIFLGNLWEHSMVVASFLKDPQGYLTYHKVLLLDSGVTQDKQCGSLQVRLRLWEIFQEVLLL